MKLILEQEVECTNVHMVLKKTEDGMTLFAKTHEDGTVALLHFSNSGTVMRVPRAQIGDFKVDDRGRLIIE